MILSGIDSAVDKFKDVVFINDLKAVEESNPGFLVVVPFKREDLRSYGRDISFGVEISSLKEFILLINTNVAYAVCEKAIAPELQKCADSYMTDMKVLVKISDENEIEWAAKNEIDGAIKV